MQSRLNLHLRSEPFTRPQILQGHSCPAHIILHIAIRTTLRRSQGTNTLIARLHPHKPRHSTYATPASDTHPLLGKSVSGSTDQHERRYGLVARLCAFKCRLHSSCVSIHRSHYYWNVFDTRSCSKDTRPMISRRRRTARHGHQMS